MVPIQETKAAKPDHTLGMFMARQQCFAKTNEYLYYPQTFGIFIGSHSSKRSKLCHVFITLTAKHFIFINISMALK